MPRPHSIAILALSLFVCALSLVASIVGTSRDGLYAEPGRAEATAGR